MFSFLTRIFGTANHRMIAKLYAEVQKINALEQNFLKLTDEELKNTTSILKSKLAAQCTLDDVIYDAFAAVREAAKRVIGQRHYDVQIIGGLILHRGMITEMRTGEGKTLVATLAAYLNSLTGQGVHIVTVNDYLAARDADWMGNVFRFLGLSVGCITANMDDARRKQAYNCDITYATNNELGFDYLRDNMKFTMESKVQRDFNFAIIDEVDSILIDEARTPLIISGPVDVSTDMHDKISKLVAKMQPSDYEIDEKSKTVTLIDNGINKIELMLAEKGFIAQGTSLYDFDNLNLVHYINQSLRAYHIFVKDVDYLVQNGKVMIIDEFTGRVMENRRYSDGLHQAIEAKEQVPIQNENQTLASITLQNYFRMYPKLSGMTGTAMTEAGELKDIYNLEVVSVPTHHKIKRIDHEDLIYGTKSEKYHAMLELIKECYSRGQPVLVGTVSIEKSEELSRELQKNQIPHNVLNAKIHEQEAHVISQAGRFKAVTIATNMAGRGTDIMLGGNTEMMISELPHAFTPEQRTIAIEQIKEQIKQEKQKVIEAGGLYVIGTERHESRRIDNQLRGRSGRQGDCGQTKFFLSLEDDLMRIFASDRIAGILRSLGLKDGEAIHHPMISNSLAKAQQKVESHNYEIRKNLLKFDNVMNEQRQIIYSQRNDIIAANNVEEFFYRMADTFCADIVQIHIAPNSLREEWKIDDLCLDLHHKFAINFSAKEILAIEGTEQQIQEFLANHLSQLYKTKVNTYGQDVMNMALKYLLITTLDQVWKEHLHSLDYLRQGISLRAYGQKDPLNEYKREAFDMFEHAFNQLRELFIQQVCYLHLDPQHINKHSMELENKQLQTMENSRQDPAFAKYNSGFSIETKALPIKAYVDPKDRDSNDPHSWGKIFRNERCPCKSGKKYKHCHGLAILE